MVAIKNSEADRFLAREVGGFAAYLVYGPDQGLVSERAGAILKALVDDPSDPFAVVRLLGDDISADPGRLADEVGSIPMFGGRRAVVIQGAGRDMTRALTHHLSLPPETPVLIEAGALKHDSALRRLIERSKSAVAIECYPDQASDLVRLIDVEVAAAGMTIDADAKALLATMLGADRLASRGEIAKLALYAHGRTSITADDVESVVADAAAQANDALIDATFLGDLAALDDAARRVLTGAAEAGVFLGAALRHAVFLHRASLDLANGAGLDQLMMQAGRMGFAPRRRDAVKRQIRIGGAEALSLAVIRLGETIGRARRDPRLATALALRTLWTIARPLRQREARTRSL